MAKILISKDNHTLQEVAHKCGFNSFEYFCSRFKKNVNMKPSSFKNKKLALNYTA